MYRLLASANEAARCVAGETLFHLSATCLMPDSDADHLCFSHAETDETRETHAAENLARDVDAYAGLFQVPGLPQPLVLMLPSQHTTHEEVELRVGYGQAACLRPSGSDRMAQLAEQGDSLLRRLVDLRTADAALAPPACLYGGLQFLPSQGHSLPTAPSGEGPWAGLPEAQFVLPRWLVRLRGRRGFLQLVATARELTAQAQILDELQAIEGALQGAQLVRTRPAAATQGAVAGLSDGQPFHDLVTQALQQIAQGTLTKVVLARMQWVQRSDGRAFDTAAALCDLGRAYPSCLRFSMPMGTATFLGATPELLVARDGCLVRCDALAGSRPSHVTGQSGKTAAQALLHDEKEAREHAYVVDAIRERLQAYGTVAAAPTPTLRVLRNVLHLWTPITATLARPVHVLSLLADLHPTPAVCGVPQAAAAQFIAQCEAQPRGYYAAPIGWFDASGDGAFYVAIRSGLVRDDRAWLFAGAGIVAGSDPDRELRETQAKLRPMRTALGIADLPHERISA